MHIDIDDTDFELYITRYSNKYNEKNWDDFWCKVTIIVNNKYFKYKEKNTEMLLSCEIDEVKEILNKVLNNKVDKEEEITFIEPDLSINIYPSYKIKDCKNILYAKDPNEIVDANIELVFNLTDNSKAYAGHKYVLPFNKEETLKLYEYLMTL